MKKTIMNISGIFLVLILAMQVNVFAQSENTTKLYVVAFHADYCGSCKAIAPKVGEVKQAMDGKPIEFLKFDFTSDETKLKTSSLAEEKGFSEFLASNNGTGFVLLIDAESKKTVGKLTKILSVDEMVLEIGKHL